MESQCPESNNNFSNFKDLKYFFRNCERPTLEPILGDVRGKLPDWLEGTLIKNGPGITRIGEETYNLALDGLAILHRFHISKGQVTYTSRALESDTYKANMEANRIVVTELGTAGFVDPCKSIFKKLQTTFTSLMGRNFTDNCNVNVSYFGDQLYALTETNFIRRIDPQTLETLGEKTCLTDYVAVNTATAHPHVRPDGTVYNMGTNYRRLRGPSYVVVEVPPAVGNLDSFDNARIIAEIPFSNLRYPSYYHSFGITEDWLIFIESPLRLDLFKVGASIWRNDPMISVMEWKEDVKTRFHVVSLKTGKIHPVIYEADGFFTFHHINAFEEDGQIVVDVAAYESGDKITSLLSRNSSMEFECYAKRFVLPLETQNAISGKNLVTLKCGAKATLIKENKYSCTSPKKIYCESIQIVSSFLELPSINQNYNGRKYNFFYALSYNQDRGSDFTSLAKVDISKRKIQSWSDEGVVPSEPIFVPNPLSTFNDEDDGVILSSLMHKDDETKVSLVVLNAKTMVEIARVDFTTAGTFTRALHGLWTPKK